MVSSRWLWPVFVIGFMNSATPGQGAAGNWNPPFVHITTGFTTLPPVRVAGQAEFNAVHMSLIGVPGPNQGKVVVWDSEYVPGQLPITQRWSVVNPEVPQTTPGKFQNFELPVSGGPGDLFCSGHAWTRDGVLAVAGGTAIWPPPAFIGAKTLYFFDPLPAPSNASWTLEPVPMGADRWYPTVTVIGNDQIIVSGGTSSTALPPPPINPALDTYEAYSLVTPVTGNWQMNGATQLFPGPGVGTGANFDIYPRMHHLSTGATFKGNMQPQAGRVQHAALPGIWQATGASSVQRTFGTAVLYPNLPGLKDYMLVIGGENGCSVWNTVEFCNAGAAMMGPPPGGSNWAPLPGLAVPRMHCSAVILPDAKVLVLGGHQESRDPMGCMQTPGQWVNTPESFNGAAWTPLQAHASPHDYHSTALLLPSGRVLLAAGENRTWDYEIFDPPYLTQGRPRPAFNNNWQLPATATYNQQMVIQTLPMPFPPGDHVAKVVLMAPGSITHHSDMHQRYVELVSSPGGTNVTVLFPPSANDAPRGYYMMFLVSNTGVPSVARWIQLV